LNIKQVIGSSLVKLGNTLTNKSISTLNSPNEYFYELSNGFNNGYQYSNQAVKLAFERCHILPTIINKKNYAFNNGKVSLLNSKGDEIVSNRLLKLYNQPNPLQTGKQHLSQIYALTQLYGLCVVLVVKPFKNIVGRMYILPNNYLTISYKQESFINAETISDLIESVTFTFNGESTILNKEDLYFYTDNSIGIDSPLFPQPRIATLSVPISNIIGSLESRNTLINSRGALGILSNDGKDSIGTMPLDGEQKKLLQEDYQKYGLSKNQWQIIITSMSLKWQQMAMPIRDLMLFENERADIGIICDAFGIKSELFSNPTGATFDNQTNYEKQLYTNSIIPDAENLFFQYNDCTLAFDNGYKFNVDYSHLPILQEDMKALAEVRAKDTRSVITMFKNNLISYNRAVSILGETEINKEFNNKFWSNLTQEQRILFDDIGATINGVT